MCCMSSTYDISQITLSDKVKPTNLIAIDFAVELPNRHANKDV